MKKIGNIVRGIIIKKVILLSNIMVMILIFLVAGQDLSAQEHKRLARVYKVDPNRDVIINSPNAAQMLRMGDKVFVIVDGKPVVMTITFPMMTVARCRLAQGYEGYSGRIFKGMQVYQYEQGIENKKLTDKDSTIEKAGTAGLQITASHPAKIYYMSHTDWEAILKTFMEGFGKTMPSSSVLKEETRKAIMNPNVGGLQISLSDIAYAIGNASATTPSNIAKLTEGEYYVWVMGNGVVAHQPATLKKGEITKVHFNLISNAAFADSNPQGAAIYVDDVPQNLTTPAQFYLSQNKTNFKITVKKEGFYDNVQYLSAKAGGDQRLFFNMTPATNAYVHVTSNPSGAHVYADGKYQGITPVKFRVNANSRVDVVVRKDGYEARSLYVKADNNDTKFVEVTLPESASTYNQAESTGYAQSNINYGLAYTMGYFDRTYGYSVDPKYFERMFTYGANNFYGVEFSMLAGKWFGYYVNVSLAGTPPDSVGTYSVKNVVLDLSAGIGVLARFWRIYMFVGIGVSYNIAMMPFDLGFGLEYKAQLGFMITEKVGIYLSFRRNSAIYLLNMDDTSSSNYGGLMGGTYITAGVNF